MPVQDQAAFPKRNAGSKERDKLQSTPQMADLREYIPVKPAGIPNFAVNDQSKIDIASTQHDFQQSMAENHFTASSFELGAYVNLSNVYFFLRSLLIPSKVWHCGRCNNWSKWRSCHIRLDRQSIRHQKILEDINCDLSSRWNGDHFEIS